MIMDKEIFGSSRETFSVFKVYFSGCIAEMMTRAHVKIWVLTRFNKIAIQGTPQMAVDKEAIICLSRVYSYYFKCNLPLFYV